MCERIPIGRKALKKQRSPENVILKVTASLKGTQFARILPSNSMVWHMPYPTVNMTVILDDIHGRIKKFKRIFLDKNFWSPPLKTESIELGLL